ncbi:MAG: hypothetical protein WBD40_23365 [Tepidisphaeraceae bacterium]
MPATRISLQQVRVAEPCPVAWDSMQGDDKARFCSHCNRHVHNLSAMPQDEAQRLVCESAGRLCIAYVPNERGGVTPLEYAKPKQPRYGWKLVAAIGGLGGVASALATAVYRPKPPPAGRMMVVGDFAPIRSVAPTTCPTTIEGTAPG